MMLDNIELVKQWSIDRNLHKQDPLIQIQKVYEEVDELYFALEANNRKEIIDGIGDTLVTLIVLAQQVGLTIPDCLKTAYEEIKDRKGKIINGTFVKEGDNRCTKCGGKRTVEYIKGHKLCVNCLKEDDYIFFE